MISIGILKLSSIDYILVVNRDFLITYNSRFDINLRQKSKMKLMPEYTNKNFFQAFPTLREEDSSIVRVMTTGEIVVKKNQKFLDFEGNIFCTNNITMPIVKRGKIIGVVEMVKDITNIESVDKKPFFDKDDFQCVGFEEVEESVKREKHTITFEDILTVNSKMKHCIEQAKVLSRAASANLIYGETGTGKEMFAQAMMSNIGISKKKMVVQNCASVPESLMESILFGAQKGAYTGAENRRGLFEEADGGVFFLDELNSLPIEVQGKLLRVLQDGTFRPIGSNTEKRVRVKVIAAMNIDPVEAVEKGQLRKDLFFRLTNGLIYLPALRERKDDIEFYVQHYIDMFSQRYEKNVNGITQELRDVFFNYDWDGNVRELKHIIESMICAFEGEVLDIKQLPAYMYDKVYGKEDKEELQESGTEEVGDKELKWALDLKKNLEEKERELIVRAMNIAKGNKTKAGELLGIPRQTLKYKITKWGITEFN